MAILNPRNKIVFFRVSEEEFQMMEEACSQVGARNISEFARIAAKRLMGTGEDQHAIKLKQSVDLMNDFLARLDVAIDRITELGGIESVPDNLSSGAAAKRRS